MSEDSPRASWSGVAARFFDLAKTNPPFWIGTAFVVLAFVRSAGTAGLDLRGSPRVALLVVGIPLLAAGLVHAFVNAKRQAIDRFADPVLYDASFWHKGL